MRKSVAQFLKDISYKLGLIADYVVEEGTSGDCRYEKWASGKAIAKIFKYQNVTFNTVNKNWYRPNSSISLDYSSAGFIKKPRLLTARIDCEAASLTSTYMLTGNTTTGANVWVWRYGSGSTYVYLACEFVGYWK